MANSVEIRTPFLDYNFVNLALSISGKWKIKNSEPKYIVKKCFEKILPKEILYRKKQGFCVPLREWASEIIINYLDQNIDKFCIETDIFRKDAIKAKIEETKNGNTNYIFMLWNLYFLIAWFRKWLL
jgi:asparagine synthase (glutamine-hydrolysing)